jgi:hypothetical protein
MEQSFSSAPPKLGVEDKTMLLPEEVRLRLAAAPLLIPMSQVCWQYSQKPMRP